MDDLENYLSQSNLMYFNKTLLYYINKKGLTNTKVYKEAYIDRKVFSKIIRHDDYIPSKKVVIRLGLVLKLNKKDFNKLLNSAGYTLYKCKFDLVISYFIEHNIYDIDTINDYLYALTDTVL